MANELKEYRVKILRLKHKAKVSDKIAAAIFNVYLLKRKNSRPRLEVEIKSKMVEKLIFLHGSRTV